MAKLTLFQHHALPQCGDGRVVVSNVNDQRGRLALCVSASSSASLTLVEAVRSHLRRQLPISR